MSKRDDLEKTIKDLQSALDKAQKELKEFNKCGRFIPEGGEYYWFFNNDGKIIPAKNTHHRVDNDRIAFYNCFRTEKEAEREKEKILVRHMLEDISIRLNGGEKIDWLSDRQRKFSIFYSSIGDSLGQSLDFIIKRQGTVYCLSNNFLNVAKEEIGTERLIRYIKEQ